MTETRSAARIVVGVDGSEHSKQALKWAARLAEPLGARIEAVIAWDITFAYGWAYAPLDWSPDEDAGKVLDQAVDEVFGADRPVGLDLQVRHGYPPKVLLGEAVGATMLVVGSRGRGGFTGLLLGSVSARCAEHATCPVLVVHGPTEPAEKPRP